MKKILIITIILCSAGVLTAQNLNGWSRGTQAQFPAARMTSMSSPYTSHACGTITHVGNMSLAIHSSDTEAGEQDLYQSGPRRVGHTKPNEVEGQAPIGDGMIWMTLLAGLYGLRIWRKKRV